MIKVTQEVLNACTDPLKEFILEFKKKAVFKSVLEVQENRHHIDGKCYNVKVVDTRVNPPYIVGSIFVEPGPDFAVCSENISNERYASYNGNYHVKRTKDVKKAVKTAIEYLRPFRWDEYSRKTRSDVEHFLRNWKREPHAEMHDAAALQSRTIIEEVVKQLEASRESPFKTEAFNKLARVVAENNEEAKRREQTDYKAVFFHIDQQGRYINDYWPAPKSENEMPEEVMSKIALLKLVEAPTSKDEVPKSVLEEVGVRTSDRDFWVYLPKEIFDQLFTPKT